MTRIAIQTSQIDSFEEIVFEGAAAGRPPRLLTPDEAPAASEDDLEVMRWDGEGGADPDPACRGGPRTPASHPDPRAAAMQQPTNWRP
ncbi:hypothetical protein [uncultured Phenylobacterium sp.]|uniref:hypothetical protein n=1 Tax=uncultured Phenylobacterium sp. TaxID=349273 RepID=UPI0025EAA20B|nr:hypothetical protein [uncultured Phenylobacterium sp.]